MADDKLRKNAPGAGDEGMDDEGLGNLPPLSDFDSAGADLLSDSDLPPLGGLESDEKGISGLPPISELHVETPVPTGGNVKPEPPAFSDLDTFDTPLESPELRNKTGFQDLAADSDFSPETPEIGPGPDSDVETPMFDSAFGGVSAATPSGGRGTSAPTQAMQTPMFSPDQGGGGFGFDEGAFGVGEAASPEIGTPIPDFSPDTAVPGKGPVMPPEPVATGKKKKAKAAKAPSGGAIGYLVKAAVIIIAIAIGIVAGPYVAAKLSFLPNPLSQKISDSETKIRSLESENKKLMSQVKDVAEPGISEARLQELIDEQSKLTAEIDQLKTFHADALAKAEEAEKQKTIVTEDLERKNEEYVTVEQALEDLKNEMRIIQARQEGLTTEVQRLTGLVGNLDEANARRLATKDALQHDVERLAILVKEGVPLTPPKFDHQQRTAEVEALKAKVAEAKWVTPELLKEYTNLYAKELEIAAANEYFFAKVPVKDRFGSQYMKWAECLMNGNWSVYYRTLDGKNIGILDNVAADGLPNWQFRDPLPGSVQKEVEDRIITSRTQDFDEKVRVLAERENITVEKGPFQRIFDSL